MESSDIIIEININQDTCKLFIENPTEHSEIENLISALFQLSSVYSDYIVTDKDSVTWKVKYGDIYEISSRNIEDSTSTSTIELDYIDFISHIVCAIIKAIEYMQRENNLVGYFYPNSNPITPFLYPCGFPYPYRYTGQSLYAGMPAPYIGAGCPSYYHNGINPNSIDNDLYDEMLRREKKLILRKKITQIFYDVIKATMEYKERRDNKE